MDEY
jgi:hypothetical protein